MHSAMTCLFHHSHHLVDERALPEIWSQLPCYHFCSYVNQKPFETKAKRSLTLLGSSQCWVELVEWMAELPDSHSSSREAAPPDQDESPTCPESTAGTSSFHHERNRPVLNGTCYLMSSRMTSTPWHWSYHRCPWRLERGDLWIKSRTLPFRMRRCHPFDVCPAPALPMPRMLSNTKDISDYRFFIWSLFW